MECPSSLWLLQVLPPLPHTLHRTFSLCLAMTSTSPMTPLHPPCPLCHPSMTTSQLPCHDLRLHLSSLTTMTAREVSSKPSDSSNSATLQLSQQLNLTYPNASLIFWSLSNSLGMQTAQAWHQEQLLQAHLKWDQHNRERIHQGMVPITLSTSLICNLAPEDVALASTATDIPPHHR